MQFGEETRWQESISDGTIVAIADTAQIRARPVEQIAFVQHDPGTLGIETEMPFDGSRQFQSLGKICLAGYG